MTSLWAHKGRCHVQGELPEATAGPPTLVCSDSLKWVQSSPEVQGGHAEALSHQKASPQGCNGCDRRPKADAESSQWACGQSPSPSPAPEGHCPLGPQPALHEVAVWTAPGPCTHLPRVSEGAQGVYCHQWQVCPAAGLRPGAPHPTPMAGPLPRRVDQGLKVLVQLRACNRYMQKTIIPAQTGCFL